MRRSKSYWRRVRERREREHRKNLKKHLDAQREKAIRMSRAHALVARIRSHLVHDWNVHIDEESEGKRIWCTDRVTVLNQMLKRCGLRRKITNRNVHDNRRDNSPGRREVWGQLEFRTDRDFHLVPKIDYRKTRMRELGIGD